MGKIRVGFDIGSTVMKIAVQQGTQFRIEEERLPENMADANGVILPNAFSQFLRRTCGKLHIPRGTAALVLPAGQAVCRQVNMPEMTEEQLLLNLPYEFADFMQGEPEQYICDYALCDPIPEEEGVPMMAAIASKRQIETYVRMFGAAGFRLRLLLPQEMALIHLAKLLHREGAPEEQCFVDLGQQGTRITVVKGDRVQARREIGLGGQNLDLAVAEEMGVDPFLANSYKDRNYQNVLDSQAVQDVCMQIAVEILKVINFYHYTYHSEELGSLVLTGGGANIPPLRRAIEETIRDNLEESVREKLTLRESNAGSLADSAGLAAVGVVLAGREGL